VLISPGMANGKLMYISSGSCVLACFRLVCSTDGKEEKRKDEGTNGAKAFRLVPARHLDGKGCNWVEQSERCFERGPQTRLCFVMFIVSSWNGGRMEELAII